MALQVNNILIRPMQPSDWKKVAAIYGEGIATGFATFEKDIPGYARWDENHLRECRLVAEKDNVISGWAALSPVSDRCVYGGVAEVSIYVSTASRGMGIGKLLMEALIDQSEEQGLWTLQSGIFPENTGSIKLHEQVGFRRIGIRERVGKLDGVWKDNVIFERRSLNVGID
ncbi:MAG TPA: GNAT family N-acetyltransferase [Eudoraea sp.]|nr:GNAT family N-acetyltransferase [Eudoraea sp.]